ncbi:MAG: hypothetical protein Q4G66_08870 [bacterium]|nr:hypothetical protein [bacterium]
MQPLDLSLAALPADRLEPATTGFDFDGVIADTVEAFLRIACEDYGHCGISAEDITSFCVEDCLPMERNTLVAIFDHITFEPLACGLKPMAGAAQVLRDLSLCGRVTIVTARPDPQPVEDWLAHTCGAAACAKIQVLAVGDHDDKERFIRKAGLSAFIDDRAETCLALKRRGIDARVFAQPWNRSPHGLPTLRGWDDISRLLL